MNASAVRTSFNLVTYLTHLTGLTYLTSYRSL
jgi:hypothetical protein